MNSDGLNNQGTIKNPLAVMQDGEKIIFEVRRHPIGLLYMYAGVGAVLIFFAIIAFVVMPNSSGAGSGTSSVVGGVLFFFAAILAMVVTFVTTIVYWGNHWIVSSDSLTQTTQQGLFRKKSAQLSLEHIEDVTADKHGLLPHLFNYGTIMVETAGESGKFQFSYCPNPAYYAQKLLAAKEDLALHGHDPVKPQTRTPRTKPIEQLGQAALNDFSSDR